MGQLAVSVLGRDRPGIVAAITGALVAHRLNIADSQMGILSGRFAAMLVVEAPGDVDVDSVAGDLRHVAEDLGMDAVHVEPVAAAEDRDPHPTHIVTVYGVDHPGIVHAVARELAVRGVNITDLNTRRILDADDEPLYAMLLEVVVPEEVQERELLGALEGVGERQHVEVTVRALEEETL